MTDRSGKGRGLRNSLIRLALLCGLLLFGRFGRRGGPWPYPGGRPPGPLPLFPPDNWWNVDIARRAGRRQLGRVHRVHQQRRQRRLHPDFGGEVSPGSVGDLRDAVRGRGRDPAQGCRWRSRYCGRERRVTGGRRAVLSRFPTRRSRSRTGSRAASPATWTCASATGTCSSSTATNWFSTSSTTCTTTARSEWEAGSGAFFDMNTNDRRPEGWTSADAAGLAILPGLVRYDEVYEPGGHRDLHAFRVTVRATNGYVYPASHRAGSDRGALPMGARLRLKARRRTSRASAGRCGRSSAR